MRRFHLLLVSIVIAGCGERPAPPRQLPTEAERTKALGVRFMHLYNEYGEQPGSKAEQVRSERDSAARMYFIERFHGDQIMEMENKPKDLGELMHRLDEGKKAIAEDPDLNDDARRYLVDYFERQLKAYGGTGGARKP